MSDENQKPSRTFLEGPTAEQGRAANMFQGLDTRKDKHGRYQPVALDDIHDLDSGNEIVSHTAQKDSATSKALIDHLRSFRKNNRSPIYIILLMAAALVVFLVLATRYIYF